MKSPQAFYYCYINFDKQPEPSSTILKESLSDIIILTHISIEKLPY